LLVSWNIIFCVDRINGALRNANGTVDTLVWIDHEKIRTFTEAVNWADVYAVSIFAADTGFGNNVSHDMFRFIAQKLLGLLGYKTLILSELAYFSGEKLNLLEVKFQT
jgi:hypothetical protein